MEQENIKSQERTLNQSLKQWARELKNNVMVMYFAMKHPETPVYAKVFAAIIVGYALSPIDLIPDFIPILGYVDEVILLPMGIALAIKMIPPKVFEACREEAKNNPPPAKPVMWVGAGVIVMLWTMALFSLYHWVRD